MNWRRNGSKDDGDTRESARSVVARHWRRCIASGPQPSQTWPGTRDAFLLLGPWIIGTASSAAKRSSTQAPIRRTVLLRLSRCIHDAPTLVLLILVKVTMAISILENIKIFPFAKTFTTHHVSSSYISQYQL